MKAKRRLVISSLLITFILIVGILLLSMYWLSFSLLPKFEGEVRIEGLENEVEVDRDRWGVPTIRAEGDRDLYMGLGYVMAQDRFWQMDLIRRFALGRLSEILPYNEDIVALDRLSKNLGMPLWISNLKDRLKSRHRIVYDSVQSFVQGINAWVNQDGGAIEYWLLDYSPEAFSVEDSLSILAYMAMSLNSSLRDEPLFFKIASKVGKTRALELYPLYSGLEEQTMSLLPKTSGMALESSFKEKLPSKKKTSIQQIHGFSTEDPFENSLLGSFFGSFHAPFHTPLDFFKGIGGSNAWVISPSKSQSNQVLLANDPHLSLGHPSIWYEAKLKSQDLDFHGFFLPLSPFGIIGQNQNIAWGITMVLEDSCDFYKEKLKKEKTHDVPEYLFQGSWQKAKRRKEIIFVRGREPVEFSVLETVHGPIVSELFDLEAGKEIKEEVKKGVKETPQEATNKETREEEISIRCTFREEENLAFPTFYHLNRAKNWLDFKEALQFYKAPGIHVVYGDKKGNIGYKSAVSMPIRSVNSGLELLDGTSGNSEWKGFLPFEKQPELFNPKEGFIVSANAMFSWQGYPFGPYTELPGRLHRIQDLISSQERLSLKDLAKIQLDQKAPQFTEKILSILLKDLNGILSNPTSPTFQARIQKIGEKRVNKALETLKTWDRDQSPDSLASSIYNLWYSEVLKEILKGKIDTESQETYLKSRFPDKLLTSLSPDSYWWDDLSTQEKKETRKDLFQKAFLQTLEILRPEQAVHTLDFRHPLVPEQGLLAWIMKPFFNTGSFPMGGNRQSINKAHMDYHKPRQIVVGASMRMLIDFGGKSHLINSTGQSGHFNHSNYRDQSSLWIQGKYRELSDPHKTQTLLILKPSKTIAK